MRSYTHIWIDEGRVLRAMRHMPSRLIIGPRRHIGAIDGRARASLEAIEEGLREGSINVATARRWAPCYFTGRTPHTIARAIRRALATYPE